MNRFVALIPVMAFAAACNGTAPTGPGQITSNESDEAVAGDASVTAVACSTLRSISLDVVPSASTPSRSTYVWVLATYNFSEPGMQRCPAPRWTSNGNQMVVDRSNPMRAGFRRSAGGSATLTATAPNRITKSIVLTIGPATSLTSSLPAIPLPQACRDIAGMNVAIVPNAGTSRDISFRATCTYTTPSAGTCSLSPAWTATRRGLTVKPRNAFRASIVAQADVRTTVTSAAPNGIAGRISF